MDQITVGGRNVSYQIRPTYLLQRGHVDQFWKPDEKIKTGDYIKFDYMGASEFEWGALPKFQREINARLGTFKIYPYVHKGERYFYACMPSQQEEYSLNLYGVLTGLIKMKCSGRFDTQSTNVWFDMTNMVLLARSESTMRNLFMTIPNSVRYMDEQQRKNT